MNIKANDNTSPSTLPPLADEILKRRNEGFLRERQAYRQDHPRASSIGDCAREIYYSCTEWPMRPVPPVELLQRFQRGAEVERLVVSQLLQLDLDVVESQLPLEIREDGIIICTGHVDGRIAWYGQKPVFDVKSLNVNVFARIENAEDFKRMGSFWAKYPRQLLLYMYANDEPIGFFILDDCLGHWKVLPMHLDDWLDECEEALQIAKRAAVGIEVGEPPDFHTNAATCRECWCRQVGVCAPPLDFSGDAMTVIEDADLIATVERLNELQDTHDEYAALKKAFERWKKAVGEGEFIVGEFNVSIRKTRAGLRASWLKLEPQPAGRE